MTSKDANAFKREAMKLRKANKELRDRMTEEINKTDRMRASRQALARELERTDKALSIIDELAQALGRMS